MIARINIPQVFTFGGPPPGTKAKLQRTEELGYVLALPEGAVVEYRGRAILLPGGTVVKATDDCQFWPACGPVTEPDRQPPVMQQRKGKRERAKVR
ncbi:MAG: hypothetical protein EHM42_13995 [Planctomycetaceae bacterium]|nr:MAG: hypothetical protein EHM42_13995 [Planctomycetaceae bacterium]